MNRLKFIILYFIVAISTNLFAAEDVLTLKEAIDIALDNSNTYAIAIEKVNQSRLAVKETWGMLWPSFSTDVSYSKYGWDEGNFANIDSMYNVSFVNAQITINPGVFYNSLQATRKAHIISETDVRTVKLNTTIQTIKLYYQLLLASESIKLREESAKALEENLKVVTVGYNKGTFSKLDYLNAKVSLSNERTQLINAKNNYLSSRASLNIYLGREINSEIYLPELTQIEFTQDEINVISISEQNEDKYLGELISESLKNRPELIQLQAKKDSQEYSVKISESSYLYPTLILSGSYGASKMEPKESTAFSTTPEGWYNGWSVTLGASYNWGSLAPVSSTSAKVKQSRSQVQQTKYEIEDFIKNVKLDVQYGFLKLKSTYNSIKSQEGNIETAEESLKVSITQFRNGIIDNTKLLNANVQLTTAKTLYIQALHDYQVAKAELNKSVGKDIFIIE